MGYPGKVGEVVVRKIKSTENIELVFATPLNFPFFTAGKNEFCAEYTPLIKYKTYLKYDSGRVNR